MSRILREADRDGRPAGGPRAIGQPSMQEMRHEIIWPNGERRAVAVTSARLSAPGTDLAVVATFTDVTDEVQNEAGKPRRDDCRRNRQLGEIRLRPR